MKLKKEEKINLDLKLAKNLDLKTIKTNLIIDYLEEQIKLREQKIEEHLKRFLKRQ